jgi:hypothetical protein
MIPKDNTASIKTIAMISTPEQRRLGGKEDVKRAKLS